MASAAGGIKPSVLLSKQYIGSQSDVAHRALLDLMQRAALDLRETLRGAGGGPLSL